MGYKYFNPNPELKSVGDCVIRALCKALSIDWETAYAEICLQGFIMHDMPSSDAVLGALLKRHGFKRNVLPDICSECYTVSDFANNCPYGTFIIKVSGHVLTVKNGTIYDSWDSSKEVVIYYYQKEDE